MQSSEVHYPNLIAGPLDPRTIPVPNAPWSEIIHLAHTFNGYLFAGGTSECAELLRKVQKQYFDDGKLDDGYTINEIRTVLFFIARADRMSDYPPDGKYLELIHALVEKIREATISEARQFHQKPEFEFSIGGYGSRNRMVQSDGRVAVLFDDQYPVWNEANKHVFLLKEGAWISFCKFLNENVVESWKKKYDENHILDGTQWELRVRNKPKFSSYGSNEYPEEFEMFLGQLASLVGNYNIKP